MVQNHLTTLFLNSIHVRRGDKIRVVSYQPVSHYMEYVERWYKLEERLTNRSLSRVLYVTTDDKSVIEELKSE